jgi:hypothetical protein
LTTKASYDTDKPQQAMTHPVNDRVQENRDDSNSQATNISSKAERKNAASHYLP